LNGFPCLIATAKEDVVDEVIYRVSRKLNIGGPVGEYFHGKMDASPL
jgi:hypothetical protein